MRFSGADRPREDQILRRGHPLAAGQGMELRGVDAVGRGEIEGVERLHFGKARLAEALSDHRLVAGGELRAEHFLEIVLVRPVRVSRLAGEAFKGPRHAWQLERARVRDHEIARQRGGAHAGTPISQPS